MKISFRNKTETKTVSDEGKLRDYVTNIYTLKGWLRKFSKQKVNERKNFRILRKKINEKSKNVGKYHAFSFSFGVLILFYGWGKNHNTV